jgi:hypothetical protein
MGLLSSLLEDVATGTGAAFTPGQGEQIATPFAFKKRRKVRVMKEADVSYTPEERTRLYDKYTNELKKWENDVKIYTNKFEGYAIGDIMENVEEAKRFQKVGEKLEEAKRFQKVGEKLEEALTKIYDIIDGIAWQYSDEEDDNVNYDKFSKVSAIYHNLYKSTYKIQDTMGDIVSLIEKIKEKE